MKQLLAQLMKFGVVGLLAFILDWGILNLLLLGAHMDNVLAATISFLISLVFNYLASMKYVFRHRDDMARWMEILIFFVSAAIGLLINDAIIWLSTLGMSAAAAVGAQHAAYALRTNIGKLVATVIVSIWNFVIRKWLLDDTRAASAGSVADSADAASNASSASVANTEGGKGGKQPSAEALDSKRERSFARRLGLWSIEHTPKGWQ